MKQYDIQTLFYKTRSELEAICKGLYITVNPRWSKWQIGQRILATQSNTRGYDIIAGK